MRPLNTLLTIANVLFLTAVLFELRHAYFNPNIPSIPPPQAATGDALVITFYAVIIFSFVGIIISVYTLIVACQRASTLIVSEAASATASTAPVPATAAATATTNATRTPWQRANMYVLLFVMNEFIFKALISTGFAVAWLIPNAAGRVRLVYPLRYISWATTNSYIFTAMSIAFGLNSNETFTSVLGIMICTLLAFPLELHPIVSTVWRIAAIISTISFFVSITSTLRRAVVLYPMASQTEVSIFSVISFTVLTTYLAFPFIFYVAILCGGEGEGSCLTNEAEAEAWIVMEGLGKLSIYTLTVIGLMFTPSIMSARTFSSTESQPHASAIKLHGLPQKYAVEKGNAAHLSWSSVLGAHAATLVVAPLLTGIIIFVAQDTLLTVIALKIVSADITAAIVSIKYATGSIAVLAALAVFFIALDRVIRTENLRALVSSIIPSGFLYHAIQDEDEWEIGSSVFSKPIILYVDEPHVTVLFADIVGFTPASVDIAPNIVMGTVGSLFRHFDQLHTAAGAVKVETSGDAYMSVIGARSMSPSSTDVPDAATQASKMATLALALIEATREHRWPNGAQIQIRVGIHCGPATSGESK
jgi:hypothetical protein